MMTEEKLKSILEEKSVKVFCDSHWLITNNVYIRSGVTKDVLVFKNRGFVIKCDKRESYSERSYCHLEAENYSKAVDMGIEKILLPTTTFCTANDGTIFYKQPIYKGDAQFDKEEVNTRAQYVEETKKREYRINKLVNLFCDSYTIGRNQEWIARAIQYYGYKFMRKVAEWTFLNDINDLHPGNVGYVGNYRPIILDYSGYYGF